MSIYVLILPLLTGLVGGIFNKSIPEKLIKFFSILFILIASLLSVNIFINIASSDSPVTRILYEWINIHIIKITIGIYLDRLTALMFCVVTIVSSVVHIYSLSYMHDDKTISKFLAYLSLFTFFMLLLVSSDNLLQLFIGWEGVGLCSYLLIGYWYKKKSANDAAIKAFIVNRVGDFAFLIALMLLFFYTKSLDFYHIFNSIEDLSRLYWDFPDFKLHVLSVICFLLFIGCMGKSAQLGLHVWLPDAMEGPTPVSALIHAATMVTAGVFLLVRMSLLFEDTIFVKEFILIIGSLTCVIMGIIGLTNNDIKKIIAYSTCSQLGYMFMACGASKYNLAMFHLATHAFFKALLFLCAGNIIHMSHEQSLNKIGGLRSKMKITFFFFTIGSMALMGIYPFAGYYSKDLIIQSLANNSNEDLYYFAYISGLIGVFFTALYSSKLIFKLFFGKNLIEDVKEAPLLMNLPLILLAVGSVLTGVYGVYVLDIENKFFIKSMIIISSQKNHNNLIEEFLPMIISLVGFLLGYVIYMWNFKIIFKPIYNLFKNKLYFDEIYKLTFVKLTEVLAISFNYIDINLIDREGPGRARKIVKSLSLLFSKVQNGYIYFYCTISTLGIVSALSWIIILGTKDV